MLQNGDKCACVHNVQASLEPAEDEADGLHVDLAANKISGYACSPLNSQRVLYMLISLILL